MSRPVVIGMPTERPACLACQKPMPYWAHHTRTMKEVKGQFYVDGSQRVEPRVVSSKFEGWMGYPRSQPVFCTLRCALRFADLAARAGYRLVKPVDTK